MTNDKISIELSELSKSLKNIGYDVSHKFYKNASSEEFDAWQKVITALIQPAPSDITAAAEPIKEAAAKLKEEEAKINPDKSAEAASAAKDLTKMGINLEKVFLKTFIKAKKASIRKTASKNYDFDQREIFVSEILKEASRIGIIKLNDKQIKQASLDFKINDFSIEKTAGFWSGVWSGAKSVLKVPLKILKPIGKILPFAGLAVGIYMAIDGFNGYIKASKYIFTELGASSIGIGKWDIFSASTMSEKVRKAIDSELNIKIPDSEFPSCGEMSGEWKCNWYYNPREPEALSWGELKKDLSDTFTSIKNLATGQQIEQYIPDTAKTGTPRNFTRTTANPARMENLAKLAKCIEAMIIHITNALDGLISSISSIIALIGSVISLGIGAPALALIDTVVGIGTAAGAYAARKVLAKDIRASIEVIMSTAQEGSQRCYMSLLSPSVEKLNELKKQEKKPDVLRATPVAAIADKEKKGPSNLLSVEKAAKLHPNYLLS